MTDEQEPTPLEIQRTRSRCEAALLILLEIREKLAEKCRRGNSFWFKGAGESWPDLVHIADEDLPCSN